MIAEAVTVAHEDWQRRLTAALWFAEQGYQIVPVPAPDAELTDCTCIPSSKTRTHGGPCSTPGKHPRGAEWQKNATQQPEIIRGHLRTSADQYGVFPFRGSGLLVIDCDDPTTETAHLPWPDTLGDTGALHASGVPKWHRFYRLPGGVGEDDVPRTWDGGEIRVGGSGQVVGPWSQTIAGPQRLPFGPRVIAQLPREVLDRIRPVKAPTILTIVGGRGAPESVKAGHRHNWLRDTARHYAGVIRDRDVLKAAIMAENAKLSEPKSEADVDRAIGDVLLRFAPDSPGPDPVSPAAIDAADLLALDLRPLREIVPGLIVEGTTVVASPPKIGKSCLIYQMVTEVAVGGDFLGRPVAAGSALYLALEDGQRRGQVRLRAALNGRQLPRGRLDVQWSARRIGAGLEDDISAWLDAHDDAAMIAIDTLQKVRPPSTGRRGAYEVDVEDLGRLQGLFRDRPIALVIVHHSRKEAGDDFLASVSGTYGITGSTDSTVVIKRKRMESFGSIYVTGREIADGEIPVRFDGLTWHEAPQALAEASFERAEVYSIIEKAGPIFPAAIAEQTGQTRQSVQNIVGKLADRGAVARTGRGYMVTATGLRSSIPDVSSFFERHQSNGIDNNGDGYPESARSLE